MSETLDLLRTVFSGLILVSISIAYLAYRGNKKKQYEDRDIAHDKEVMAQAVKSLEWSYSTLSGGNDSELPLADRLNWLTSARHIQRYYSLRALLKTETYKLLCSEHEEYWRHKYYLLLDRRDFCNSGYFKSAEDPDWPENIEVRSALIISIFSQWNADTVDPLDTVTMEGLEEQQPYKGLFGIGLKGYVDCFKR